jgi:hypothetical protein
MLQLESAIFKTRSYQYLYSPDSRVDWNMRDCNLHGGRITLGEPDDGSWYGAPPDWVYGPCAVSWVNNLFDGVAIDLDPTFYQFGFGLNCDMAFEAYNNLVREAVVPLAANPRFCGRLGFQGQLV